MAALLHESLWRGGQLKQEAYLGDPEKCEAKRSWGGTLAVSNISDTNIYNLLSVCSCSPWGR